MSWTKEAEITWLRKAIKHLGPNSYLGPWLAENAGRIEQDILSDFQPTSLLPGESYTRGTELMAETKRECEAMLTAATAKRDAMVKDTADRIDSCKALARAELRRLADRI